MSDNYLQHHGVKGMHWGVRKDYDIVSAHKRNKAIKEVKAKYMNGNVSQEAYKSAKKAAKSEFRNRYKTLKSETSNMSKEERKAHMKKISSTRITDIPYSTALKGAHIVSGVITASAVIKGVSGTLASVSSAALVGYPPVAIGAVALGGIAGTAIGAGVPRAIRKGVINAVS